MNGLRLITSAAILALGIEIVTAKLGEPIRPATECPEEGFKFADTTSVCWFHICLLDGDGFFYTLPSRCALGSRVDNAFIEGIRNPCTINFDSSIGYECDRTEDAADVPPPCTTDGSVVCYNGGTLTYEANHCWCLCDPEWEGDFDCSKPTGFYEAINANGDFDSSNICVGGEPDDDYCYHAGGCLNQGICYNQCRGFWCDCPNIYDVNYVGKRCETSDKK